MSYSRDVDTAWVGVIGTLGGVALTSAIGLVRDKRQASDIKATRWHDERRRVYAAFLKAADNYHRAGRDAATSLVASVSAGGEAVDTTEPLAAMAHARDQVADLTWEIALMSGDTVRQAADELYVATQSSFAAIGASVGRYASPNALERLTKTEQAHRAAVEAFRVAARTEIDVAD